MFMSSHSKKSELLYLVATLEAVPGSEGLLLDALSALVLQSRAEPGCIQYDPHVDIADAKTLIVYEIWRNQQALDDHASSSHFQAFLKTAEPMLSAPLDVKVLNRID
jgi:quinol monooxygenase YgiN